MNRKPVSVLRVLVAILFLAGISVFLPHTALAATSESILPAAGAYSGYFTLSVVINTGGDAIDGVDTEISYSGPATYVSAAGGDLGCTPTVQNSAGNISIICLIPPGDGFNGEGTVATLTFRATGSGTFTVTPSFLDVGSENGALTGGTYTLSQSAIGNITRLPDTGLLDDHPEFVVATFLIFLSIVIIALRTEYPKNVSVLTEKKVSPVEISRKNTKLEKRILEKIRKP